MLTNEAFIAATTEFAWMLNGDNPKFFMWPHAGFNHANHALQAFVDNVAIKMHDVVSIYLLLHCQQSC